MAKYSLVGLSGSLRAEATNTKLIREAARLFEAESFSLADLSLPLYNGDDEAASGIPPAVQRLADQIAAADAVLISTPEYNRGLSGVLKNALDWVSRVEGSAWAGKPVALMSSAAGRSGGDRGLVMLHSCMTPFQPKIVAGPEVTVAASYNEFDAEGRLQGELYVKNLTALMANLRAAI